MLLENKLPLEFADSAEEPIAVPCESCEVIVDETNKVVYDQRSVPDVPVTKVAAEASTTTGANRAKTGETVETAPIETGYSHRNARVRHRRSHGQKGVQKS